MDLDAYFNRIRYPGPRAATLETLEAIHLGHALAIPFENLNPLLRYPVALDLDSLQRKLVMGGRGGYCFEHNLLLKHVLTAMGFTVTGLAARVVWNAPPGAITPRGHMLLLIHLNGQAYIADVGFGGLTLTAPLRLKSDIVQATPHEPFRLLSDGDGFVAQAKIGETWTPLYRFDLQEQFQADYEVTNWYLSNHPHSHFVTGLIAARPDRNRRYALRNHELAVHHANGPTERRRLATPADVRGALEEIFLLRLPDGPELSAALDRICGVGRGSAAALLSP